MVTLQLCFARITNIGMDSVVEKHCRWARFSLLGLSTLCACYLIWSFFSLGEFNFYSSSEYFQWLLQHSDLQPWLLMAMTFPLFLLWGMVVFRLYQLFKSYEQGNFFGNNAQKHYSWLVGLLIGEFVMSFLLQIVTAYLYSQYHPSTGASINFEFLELIKQKITESKGTYLVFAGFPKLAELLVDSLKEELGDSKVEGFFESLDVSKKEMVIVKAKTNSELRVLVSDESGGEGRNFEFMEEIIHYDNPWALAQFEQRIGRIDRFGRNEYSDSAKSNIFYGSTKYDTKKNSLDQPTLPEHNGIGQ